jgi:hypothetical protein
MQNVKRKDISLHALRECSGGLGTDLNIFDIFNLGTR